MLFGDKFNFDNCRFMKFNETVYKICLKKINFMFLQHALKHSCMFLLKKKKNRYCKLHLTINKINHFESVNFLASHNWVTDVQTTRRFLQRIKQVYSTQ